jgi:hypothetical protein
MRFALSISVHHTTAPWKPLCAALSFLVICQHIISWQGWLFLHFSYGQARSLTQSLLATQKLC